jgi:hypothetical protein
MKESVLVSYYLHSVVGGLYFFPNFSSINKAPMTSGARVVTNKINLLYQPWCPSYMHQKPFNVNLDLDMLQIGGNA